VNTQSSNATATECILIYESTPEYRAYLIARAEWATAHANYLTAKCDATFTALRAAHDRSHEALTVCRTIPEHLAAFGW
jgi:hypothetical protein